MVQENKRVFPKNYIFSDCCQRVEIAQGNRWLSKEMRNNQKYTIHRNQRSLKSFSRENAELNWIIGLWQVFTSTMQPRGTMKIEWRILKSHWFEPRWPCRKDSLAVKFQLPNARRQCIPALVARSAVINPFYRCCRCKWSFPECPERDAARSMLAKRRRF